MEPRVLVKGQNVALDPEIKGLRMSVRWASRGDAVDVDLVALIIGEDRRVRSDADMIFYNQPGTGDGSVVHAGKVLGDGHGTDDVSVDIALLADDVTGLTVAASTDGAPFSEIDELQWCVFLENGEATVIYTVDGLTTERALVLGELYRRAGSWRLRAVGQGWEGGLAGLATDYGVSIDAEGVEPGNNATGDEEFDVIETPTTIEAAGDPTVVESDLTRSVIADSDLGQTQVGVEQNDADLPAKNAEELPPVVDSPSAGKASTARVRVTAVKSAAVPTMRLADDAGWQPSRLFSIAGIGGVEEQEKRATSALLWAMSGGPTSWAVIDSQGDRARWCRRNIPRGRIPARGPAGDPRRGDQDRPRRPRLDRTGGSQDR